MVVWIHTRRALKAKKAMPGVAGHRWNTRFSKRWRHRFDSSHHLVSVAAGSSRRTADGFRFSRWSREHSSTCSASGDMAVGALEENL